MNNLYAGFKSQFASQEHMHGAGLPIDTMNTGRATGVDNSNIIDNMINHTKQNEEEQEKWDMVCKGFPMLKTVISMPNKMIAIGDIHGDMDLLMTILRESEVIDKSGNWTGGDTVVVQVGDQIDSVRQGVSQEDMAEDLLILEYFTRLHIMAQKKNGGVYSLLGNHELMNIAETFEYVSKENMSTLWDAPTSMEHLRNKDQLEDVEEWKEAKKRENQLEGKCENYKKRERIKHFQRGKDSIHANLDTTLSLSEKERQNIKKKLKFKSNEVGDWARFLACTRQSALIVGDWLFVHAGLSQEFMERYEGRKGLEEWNDVIRHWILGIATKKEEKDGSWGVHNDQDSPFWTRIMGRLQKTDKNKHCDAIKSALDCYSIKGMAIGHTPQYMLDSNQGISGICEVHDKDQDVAYDRLWRIDTGSSRAFGKFSSEHPGRQPQVLIIHKNKPPEIKVYD